MKIDMHTHTSQGSLDGMICIKETIKKLKSKGFDGMLVTDHNSYAGYNSRPVECERELNNNINNHEATSDFVILRGIEYDTSDAGHMLIILPTDKEYDLFTAKGMTFIDTVKVVHALGGVIGAAHPYDYYKFGMLNHDKWVGAIEVIQHLDFIETFNACASTIANKRAKRLAERLNVVQTGGSDSHVSESVGLGATIFNQKITNEDDLIKVIKQGNFKTNQIVGEQYQKTTKERYKKIHAVGIRMYYSWSWATNYINQRGKIRKLKRDVAITAN